MICQFQKNLLYASVILFAGFVSSCVSAENELQNLFDNYWDHTLKSNPVFATGQGVHQYNHLLAETGLEAAENQYQQNKLFLTRLSGISRENLDRDNQISYDILNLQLNNAISSYELNGHLLPLNGWWDYHASFAELPNRVPLNNAEDYENYLDRLSSFDEYNAGYIERMQKGIELEIVRPAAVFEDYLTSIEAHIVDAPEESLLFEPFKNFPGSINDEERERLMAEGRDVLESVVLPEYERLRDFLRDEYIPATRESIAITDLVGGEDYYQHLIERYTTLNLTADEIHQIGLDEVERIRADMMKIVEQQGFGDDFESFVEFLRNDEQFYAGTPEELLKETAYILKRIDGKLPELFKTLPRLPYGIQPIPGYLAAGTATAYYSRGAADGTRAGNYAVNTYDLNSRPLYEIEALSLHEAVPGHHLQIALQQELENLPEFRSTANFTSFVEGWALYAESLGDEMGFYEDPYSNFGRLSYEMWRALRLVVDTGMHAKGWGRKEAIDYMAENSALSLHNIRSEVNRYIFWPAQALAYKMGELKIKEIRARAETILAEEFSVREFHDVVLRDGSIPLYVLEENVEIWIEEKSDSAD